jgi:alkylation response protein AidB-like acyl-CoA dehydrogenase
MDELLIRRNDYSLDEGQLALRQSFKMFFERHCPIELIRKAEPLGWDESLWTMLADLRPVATAIPTNLDGDGGGLVEMALICEEAGRRAAPVPLVDTAVAARLLAAISNSAAVSLLNDILGGAVATIALGPPAADGRILTSSAAIAGPVLGMRGTDLVVSRPSERPLVENLASAPLAWCQFEDAEVLASGPFSAAAFATARQEWRLLTAAALIGLGDSAKDVGIQYAKDRQAFGVPIGSFQAIAHPLADVAIGIEGARRLMWKACWFADNEPEGLGSLAEMAFIYAAESAEKAGFVAIHAQGGFGFTLESDAQIFYRRAKGWSLIGGDRRAELRRVGRAAFEGTHIDECAQ